MRPGFGYTPPFQGGRLTPVRLSSTTEILSQPNTGSLSSPRNRTVILGLLLAIAITMSHDEKLKITALNNLGRAYTDLGDEARARQCFAAAASLGQ